jgi:opacity protein-like surface antigen
MWLLSLKAFNPNRMMSGVMVAMTLLLFPATSSYAAGIDIIPSIELKQEYNDNIDFEADNPEEDFITTITPGIDLKRRTERLNTALAIHLSALKYADNRNLDTVDQYYNGGISYQLSPRMSVSGNAGYKIDSRTDRDIETTGLTLTGDRKAQNYVLAWDYLLTEKTRVSLSWSHGYEDIEKPDDEENRSHKIAFGITHDLSAFLSSTVGRMNISYMRYDSEDREYYQGIFLPVSGSTQEMQVEQDSVYDIYQCTFGGSHQFSELLEFSLDTGLSYTLSDQDIEYVVNIDEAGLPWGSTSDEWDNFGFVGNAALTWSGEYTRYTTTLSHDIRTASGENGTMETTALTVYGSHRFSDKLQALLHLGYYRNRSDRKTGSETDEYTLRIRPGLRYNFTRNFWVEASYLYTTIDDLENDDDRNRNLFYIRLKKNFNFEP